MHRKRAAPYAVQRHRRKSPRKKAEGKGKRGGEKGRRVRAKGSEDWNDPRPAVLLERCMAGHPTVAALVPDWLRVALRNKEIAKVAVGDEEVERLRQWVVAYQELRKALSYSAAMKAITAAIRPAKPDTQP
eukprot:TRINITY_DN13184_c0_g1_i1.p1 TRINITY_DN13184_c0_g1~~TRINITY_DN13184_c0_g1_i1.p1  ORF type:complete len:131 (-),score=27.67 TRINITY_DN13184_c0_g1_i1:319-711(-)